METRSTKGSVPPPTAVQPRRNAKRQRVLDGSAGSRSCRMLSAAERITRKQGHLRRQRRSVSSLISFLCVESAGGSTGNLVGFTAKCLSLSSIGRSSLPSSKTLGYTHILVVAYLPFVALFTGHQTGSYSQQFWRACLRESFLWRLLLTSSAAEGSSRFWRASLTSSAGVPVRCTVLRTFRSCSMKHPAELHRRPSSDVLRTLKRL